MDKTKALQHSQAAYSGNRESIRALFATMALAPAVIEDNSDTATATGGAATLNKRAGKITTASLSTGAGLAYTLTLTNSEIAAADMVFAKVANGTNSQGIPIVGRITEAAGSVTIEVRNEDGAVAFNGTLVISFFVVKA